MKGKPWRKEEEVKLKRLISKGVTLKIIAAKLGKTEGAIRAKARKLGLEVVKKLLGNFLLLLSRFRRSCLVWRKH